MQRTTLVKKEKADICFHLSRRAIDKFASALTIQVHESYASFQQNRRRGREKGVVRKMGLKIGRETEGRIPVRWIIQQLKAR